MKFSEDGTYFALQDAPKLKPIAGSITLSFYDGIRAPKMHFKGTIQPEQVRETSNRIRRMFADASRIAMKEQKMPALAEIKPVVKKKDTKDE